MHLALGYLAAGSMVTQSSIALKGRIPSQSALINSVQPRFVSIEHRLDFLVGARIIHPADLNRLAWLNPLTDRGACE